MTLSFLWIYAGFALLLPVLVRAFSRAVPEQIRSQALCVPFFKDLPQAKIGGTGFASSSIAFIFIAAWIALILAFMRPVSLGEPIYIPQDARQLMLALDVSNSMSEQDFVLNNRRLSRLSAVQALAKEFIKGRQGDAVGLTIFGSEAFIYVPLTQDVTSAAQMLDEIGVGIAGNQTAIGDALAVALKEMSAIEANKKVIVLLSDGVANAGIIAPLEAAQKAKEMGVKVYTVGIGANAGGIDSFFFLPRGAELDEQTLKQMASITGGEYYRVQNTQDLAQMYAVLDKIEPVSIQGNYTRPQKELFFIPLFIAMILFGIGFYLKGKEL